MDIEKRIQAEFHKTSNRIMENLMLATYWTPPSQPITVNDAAVALEMDRMTLMGWIQDISYALPYSKKDRRAFLTEWRSSLWDLHSYLTGNRESVNGVPVLMEKKDGFDGLAARYSSLSSSSTLTDSILNFYAKVE